MVLLTKLQTFFFQTLDSTSNRAKELAEVHCGNFCVVSRRQTGGRGRLGRKWLSPEGGGVYISFCFDREGDISSVPLKVALLLCRWLLDSFGIVGTIKWPNDILCDGRKLAGILCEAINAGSNREVVVVGVGINIDIIDVSLEGVRPISLRDVCNKLLDPLELSLSLRDYWNHYWKMIL